MELRLYIYVLYLLDNTMSLTDIFPFSLDKNTHDYSKKKKHEKYTLFC